MKTTKTQAPAYTDWGKLVGTQNPETGRYYECIAILRRGDTDTGPWRMIWQDHNPGENLTYASRSACLPDGSVYRDGDGPECNPLAVLLVELPTGWRRYASLFADPLIPSPRGRFWRGNQDYRCPETEDYDEGDLVVSDHNGLRLSIRYQSRRGCGYKFARCHIAAKSTEDVIG